MSRIGCRCGNTITDTQSNLPYKADLLPDQSMCTAFDGMDEVIQSLIEATKNNARREWIAKQFNDQYPKDLTDSQMIGDIFDVKLFDITRTIYQCEKCGRILIQKGKSNSFISFKAETDGWEDLLKGET